jgi:NAD(P)-dependent dehydrogenase (short-subunit alcohol dehydrogenase family)
MNPQGQAALVTGGGSGLGAAAAMKLAARGAKVAVLDVNADTAKAVAAKIGGLAIACDVTQADGTAAAFAQARAAHGPARILVNCAGVGPAKRIVGRDGPMPLPDFERVIRINLIGTFNAMRLAAADMQGLEPLEDDERGVIVSTASVAAFEGQIGQAAYAASKGGARARPVRHPGERDRARHLLDPDAAGAARGYAEEPRGRGAIPQAARPAGAICRPRPAHRREPLSQRRDHQA